MMIQRNRGADGGPQDRPHIVRTRAIERGGAKAKPESVGHGTLAMSLDSSNPMEGLGRRHPPAGQRRHVMKPSYGEVTNVLGQALYARRVRRAYLDDVHQ
jgi:hypothetical protein